MAGDVVFTAVVTRHLLDEYRLFRESFRIYHGFDPVSVVRCDTASRQALEALPNTIAIVALESGERPVSQSSDEFRSIMRHKMLVMTDAWRLLSPEAVAYIDADMVVLRAFRDVLDDFRAPLTLSPHYYPRYRKRQSRAFGFYNAGLILSRDASFARWWLQVFDEQPELFADQACLNAAPKIFATEHFPEAWNVGLWRSGSWYLRELSPIPADVFTVHAHIIAAARPESSWEVVQKDFVAAAIDFVAQRGTPRDEELLGVIASFRDRELDTPVWPPAHSGERLTIRSVDEHTEAVRRGAPIPEESRAPVFPRIRSKGR
jgi:hypothetical protein